jgi:hypothetical protein
MKKLIYSIIFALPIMMAFSAPIAFAGANTQGAVTQVCNGLNTASGGTGGCTDGSSEINSIIALVVNILTIIVGVVAVIMIVIAGFRFVVSGGESSAVASAKNSIIYVVVGVVIVSIAQIIVHFVLHGVNHVL